MNLFLVTKHSKVQIRFQDNILEWTRCVKTITSFKGSFEFRKKQIVLAIKSNEATSNSDFKMVLRDLNKNYRGRKVCEKQLESISGQELWLYTTTKWVVKVAASRHYNISVSPGDLSWAPTPRQ